MPGKKFKAAAAKVDRNKRYLVADAFKLLKEATVATKFDQTIDVAINLGIDPKHADQMVRGAIVLPHGTGKSAQKFPSRGMRCQFRKTRGLS